MFQKNVPLTKHNSLAVPSMAKNYFVASNKNELIAASLLADQQSLPINILGGGSNVVLAPVIEGLVLHVSFLEYSLVEENKERVIVRVGAGEHWHHTVERCVEAGYFGIENLALIPGKVGAAPIQNIGAYGVEFKDVAHAVNVWDRRDHCERVLTVNDCDFSYRHSVFKNQPGRYVVTSVELKLGRSSAVNLSYPALAEYLSKQGISDPTPRQIMAAVIAIRQSKLPDPKILPNAGSFFKNPIVENEFLQKLLITYPDLAFFDLPGNKKKVAAAWLIDRAGWKGKTAHGIKVHDKHALVLTNPHRENAQAIQAIVSDIQRDVEQLFGILLETEPQFLS